jgi:nitrogen fixation/metabolism regulation signal transduction histidine kinase
MKLFTTIKSLKNKLLIQFGILIFLSSILMGVMLYYFNKVSDYNITKNNTTEINNIILQLRKCEKDFLLQDVVNEEFFTTNESKSLKKFSDNYIKAEESLKSLSESRVIGNLELKDSINIAKNYLKDYSTIFNKLVNEYKVKGFKDFGHEGDLRKAIHSIEDANYSYDKILILTLRRHEKDFLLRKDMKYVEKFDKSIEDFLNSTDGANPELKQAILNYSNKFHDLVETEKQIGITLEEGIKKELRETIHKIEPLLESFKIKISNEVDNAIFWTYIYIAILFLIQLVIGITLALLFANSITSSVQVIQERISKLSNGIFPDKIIPDTQDELGETSIALNNLVDRVKTAATFAGKIGEGELNIIYDENFSNDVLANSLQAMHYKLKETAEDSRKRNWVTVGLANCLSSNYQ